MSPVATPANAADGRAEALAKLMFSMRRALVERRQIVEIGASRFRFLRRNEEFDEGEVTYQALASGVFMYCDRSSPGGALSGVWLHLGSSDDLEALLASHLKPMTAQDMEALRITISANAALQSLDADRPAARAAASARRPRFG